ncbi:hypothetical protein I2I11_16935 [Pontibacter sp. 172403-2]|uniref:hypothetical protein n=1 Tax=Pontibacter rufus TaxID=2791028 RepID=UPI0018AFD511|nr:hypothetical protein [Pontibacter sp. 172403-2]MBF9254992.1 hypothetical protein [Pontibacter sp. 172403-2]
MKKQATTWLGMLLFLTIFGACSTTKEVEDDVQDELADFRSWVSTTTADVANRTEEDWEQARQDFRMRTQELDQKQNEFSEDIKQDYQELKQEFIDTDEMYTRSHQEAKKAEWEHNLLGRWADLASINETNVQEAYVAFMENVRAKHQSWTDQEWEMAEMVMNTLNEHKKEINGDIPTDTEVKIKALQLEFHTLETAADVTD